MRFQTQRYLSQELHTEIILLIMRYSVYLSMFTIRITNKDICLQNYVRTDRYNLHFFFLPQINGKRAQFKDVAKLLRAKGIDLDHNRFLILQVP